MAFDAHRFLFPFPFLLDISTVPFYNYPIFLLVFISFCSFCHWGLAFEFNFMPFTCLFVFAWVLFLGLFASLFVLVFREGFEFGLEFTFLWIMKLTAFEPLLPWLSARCFSSYR